MIDYIYGEVAGIYENYIVLENQGLGYRIFTSNTTKDRLLVGDTSKIHTEMIVREDSLSLYGFDTMEEMEMFRLLITVTSIGPKNALGILSSMHTEIIKYCIVENDIDKLTEAPGVGKKTAGRIVLELKDKIKSYDIEEDAGMPIKNDDYEFALDALVNLGYQRNEVVKFLQKAAIQDLPIDQMIKEAMKGLEHKE